MDDYGDQILVGQSSENPILCVDRASFVRKFRSLSIAVHRLVVQTKSVGARCDNRFWTVFISEIHACQRSEAVRHFSCGAPVNIGNISRLPQHDISKTIFPSCHCSSRNRCSLCSYLLIYHTFILNKILPTTIVFILHSVLTYFHDHTRV